MAETLLLSKSNNIATITFNRPDMMNSFDHRMADELVEMTDEVAKDDTIRAVLLNGSGRLFMAGGDIQFFYNSLDTMPKGVMKIVTALNKTIMNFMSMPKPVLASVHGSVAGAGMSLMMACDLVIASDKTKFTMAYSGLGISPDGGASYQLPRIVGPKKALEWLLLSDVFDANEARLHGLINWVVTDDQLKEETARLIERLSKGPTESYRRTKKLVNDTWGTALEIQLQNEGVAFEQCTTTLDFKTGVKAFLKKIKPEFVGK